MLFNSIEFLIFLPIVLLLYWLLNKNLKAQNSLLLLASYIFYGWWDWRFLFLIFFSSSVDFLVGILLEKQKVQSKRRLIFLLSCFVNIIFLGFFKYFNFFIHSFVVAFGGLGIPLHDTTLKIILPIGISFYTFQSLSYTIDVYRRNLAVTRKYIDFLAFVSFFPHMVAGPIQKAGYLLPQIQKKRVFDKALAKDGLRQMLWGFFKKIVIADNCASIVDYTFANYHNINSSGLILGAVYFAFQIYSDFSGYTDIATGVAKLFGIRFTQNFSVPYFSRDIAEFWRRWHISLSSWFKEYVYIPLGGSRCNKAKRIRNILITFTLSGLWHGANWTYLFWGFLNGLYYIPLMLSNKYKAHKDTAGHGRYIPSLKELLQIFCTFSLSLFAWIFFRSVGIKEAIEYIKGTLTSSWFNAPNTPELGKKTFYLIAFLLIVEWIQREKAHALQIEKLPIWVRWPAYYIVLGLIFIFYKEEQVFIYFQF
jgi:alginate O-acetyltransferase complex protein AlgI